MDLISRLLKPSKSVGLLMAARYLHFLNREETLRQTILLRSAEVPREQYGRIPRPSQLDLEGARFIAYVLRRRTEDGLVISVGSRKTGRLVVAISGELPKVQRVQALLVESLGQMSCNPSIGGIGKGHLVKEIDALGGAMAAAADEAGIQFRILNASKGPAVRATRAQADRVLYRQTIRRRIENQPNLAVFQQAVDDLLLEGDRVAGVVTQIGLRFRARAVVLTTGTFLSGLIHVGLENYRGGRAGDPAAAGWLRQPAPGGQGGRQAVSTSSM